MGIQELKFGDDDDNGNFDDIEIIIQGAKNGLTLESSGEKYVFKSASELITFLRGYLK